MANLGLFYDSKVFFALYFNWNAHKSCTDCIVKTALPIEGKMYFSYCVQWCINVSANNIVHQTPFFITIHITGQIYVIRDCKRSHHTRQYFNAWSICLFSMWMLLILWCVVVIPSADICLKTSIFITHAHQIPLSTKEKSSVNLNCICQFRTDLNLAMYSGKARKGREMASE